MKHKLLNSVAVTAIFAGTGAIALQAQYGPVVNIGERHGNLRRAQEGLVSAYQAIDQAQHDNDGQLGGHAQRAKDLITQADQELRAAANYANQR